MDLVAGETRDILLALAVDDVRGFEDRDRFTAYLSLGGGLDPSWLDYFAEAARDVTGSDDPSDFLDARRDLDGDGQAGERTVERIDRSWITAVARVPDQRITALASRWIDLLEEDLGSMPGEEKPWIRDLASQIVTFAREAETAPDVLFAWTI